MAHQQACARDEKERIKSLDEDYLKEFRTVDRQCDVIHTVGNVGKIGSMSLESI
jgi:hypothetical protein